MESSSSRSKQSLYNYPHPNHNRFLITHLGPAIDSKSCSICLSQIEQAAVITVCLHAYCLNCIRKWSNRKRKCPLCNARFNSLFVGIDIDSMTFRTHHLSDLKEESGAKVNDNVRDDFYGRRRDFIAQRRAIGISREQNVVNKRTRPLPKQRSFGQLPPGVSKERILHWRASIYKQNLLAVPCPTRKSLEQGLIGRNSHINKEMVLKRIEPRIHRELHAVLGDPNPAILVHLVTSLFISSLEGSEENNYLERLQPFLLKRSSTFWHELRCFAESSLNMETYDSVVKYEKASN